MDFRTLGSSKMSVSSRRNVHFRIFDLPQSRSKSESKKSSTKVGCYLLFEVIFWSFFSFQNVSENQFEKKLGNKSKKDDNDTYFGPARRKARSTGEDIRRGQISLKL